MAPDVAPWHDAVDDGGQSVSTLPTHIRLDLFRDRERVVDLDAKVADRAFYFRMSKQ